MSACGAPSAIDVNTPNNTASPHPSAMQIQPPPLPYVLVKLIFALTPQPNAHNTAVPHNSPNKLSMCHPSFFN
jgi:hypothetical protein